MGSGRECAPGRGQHENRPGDPYPRAPMHPDPHKDFTLETVEIEISPEPTDEERAAILAALAEKAEMPPAPWQEETPADP